MMRGLLPSGAASSETAARTSLLGRIDRYVEASTSRWGLVLLLTLTTTATHPPRGSAVATPMLAGLGVLLLRRFAWDWRYWGLLTVTTAIGVLSHPIVDLDNHHFLHVYWLLAITLACCTKDPRVTLARTSRLLVGWLFVFATAWKLLTPDFSDGSFLTYLLSVDGNVVAVPLLLGWQDEGNVGENRSAIARSQHDPLNSPEPVSVEVAPSIDRVARPLSIVTVALEAAVALSFLLPLRGPWTRVREASLLTFVLLTYAVLPVLSFAALLIAMSLASSTLRPPRLQLLHVAALLVAAGIGLILQGSAL
jgi:hypothetical protein